MKFVALLAVSAAALLSAAPAFAGPASSTIDVNGNVAVRCGAGGHGSDNSTPSTASATQSIDVGDISDTNGRVKAIAYEANFGNLWCNSASNMTVTVQPLKTDQTVQDTSSFFNTVDLKVTVPSTYMGANNIVTTAGAEASKTTYIPYAIETGTGQYAKVTIETVVPSQDRPISGAYKGAVILTVSAG